jgi:hypothetical protein
MCNNFVICKCHCEAKFGPLEKIMKNDWHQPRWTFSEEKARTPSLTEEILEDMKVNCWREINKIKIKLATSNKNEQQQDAKNAEL